MQEAGPSLPGGDQVGEGATGASRGGATGASEGGEAASRRGATREDANGCDAGRSERGDGRKTEDAERAFKLDDTVNEETGTWNLYECVVCQKVFKKESQLRNHEHILARVWCVS